MKPTKIAARLPGIDVEICKQTFPERNAETISVHITATPSFEVAVRWLLEANLFALVPVWYAWANLLQAWRPLDQYSLSHSAPVNRPLVE